MIATVDPEVWQTVGLAVMLVCGAGVLDLFARRKLRHAADRKTVGFRYRREMNAWQCSEGYFLWLREIDDAGRVGRYRASAETCNRCGAKRFCTDSNQGRELVHSLDPFPPAEEGQVQRGLSLLLLAVAAAVLLVGAVRHHQDPDLILLAAIFAVVAAAGRITLRHFLKWCRYTEQPNLVADERR